MAGEHQPGGELGLVLQLLHGALSGGGGQTEPVPVEGGQVGGCLQLAGLTVYKMSSLMRSV